MERKRFTGWIDGHYVSGTYTEENTQDVKETNEAVAGVVADSLKLIGGLLLGGIALAALVAKCPDDKE